MRPPRCVSGENAGSVDLVRPTRAGADAPAVLRLRLGGRVAVAVERERRLDAKRLLESGATLLPPLLIFELVLVQRRRLPDAVRVPELHRELGRAGPDVIPRGAERELVGD